MRRSSFERASSSRACGARSSAPRWSGSPTRTTRLAGVLMRGPPPALAAGVELDAEPRRVAADALADRRRVLADAGGEHERVEAAERGGQRAELAADAVDEQIDRQPARAARRSRAARACRSRCPTRRAGPTACRSASRSRARPSRSSSIRYRITPGSSAAAARAHRQAVDGGEAHRARDAACRPRARTCWRRCRGAATTVRPAAALRVELRQHAGDVLVRQAVEAVAPHAALGDQLRGSANACATLGLRAVERGVEAGDLRQLRQRARAATRIGARLCGWCSGASGTQLLERREHVGVDPHRLRELACRRARRDGRRPTRRVPAVLLAQEVDEVVERAVVPELRRPRPSASRRSSRPSRPWRRSAARCRGLRPGRAATSASSSPRVVEQRELDARRAGVEDEDRVGHGVTPATLRRSRGAPAATSAATAHEASRVITESARLVRMIGTRAPSTMPAASAPARNDRLLASMLPASRSGTTSTLARPATGESIFLICAASRLIALSSASGPSRMRAGDLAAVGHLAQRRGLDRRGHLRVDRLHRRQDRDAHLRRRRSACARSIAFCTMSTLSSSVGAMLTAASVMISASG